MKANSRPRWLIIAHAFNMDGRAASQTITDKLPHLLSAGIDIVVLSGVSGRKDKRFEHHQLWPVGPAGVRFELRHVLRKRWGSGFTYRFLITIATIALLPLLLIEKILRPIESSWSWWLSAYVKGRLLEREKPFDLIYSTGGAFAAHIAARALKKATGTLWLAEVHDPLVMPGKTPFAAQEKMQLKVEGQICSEADVAVWFTDQALASALVRHPQLGSRGKVMLPGIDNPFEVFPEYQAGDKFVIGHFGSLSTTRHLGPIIKAMELLFDRRPKLLAIVELHVYGGPLDSISSSLLSKSKVQHNVYHFGRIEEDPASGLSGRQQILNRMRSVDLLLLLHGDAPICAEYIPSKLYEYLWMQRPILAVVFNNPQMAEIIVSQGHKAISLDIDELKSDLRYLPVATAIEGYIDSWSIGANLENFDRTPYTTKASVTQLLGWVNELSEVSV